ncbi:MAG: cupin domain-containing protein [Pseudomonadales bacterium]
MKEVNADFSKRVVVHGAELEWQDSPMAGVSRRMLDRIGDEVARATTIVRYDTNSHFSPHVHTGGEEFVVLQGVFQDEHGDFPVGSYIRNPPQSKHTPGSKPGCVIFVKLWQFDMNDRTHIRTDINKIGALSDPTRPGVTITPLYEDERELVRVEQWQPGTELTLDTSGGAEILVLEGGFEESGDSLRPQSWLRIPIGGNMNAKAGPQGARVWVKTGHLRFVELPQQS